MKVPNTSALSNCDWGIDLHVFEGLFPFAVYLPIFDATRVSTKTEPTMSESADDIRSMDDLRTFVHSTLCHRENLVADQFSMSEMQLNRRGRECGLQFSIHGPRSVRLGAIWASDHNTIYFYDAAGIRFSKVRLRQRLLPTTPEEEEAA